MGTSNRGWVAAIALMACFSVLGVTLPSKPASAQTSQGIAAIVNDEIISTFDVDQRVRLVVSSSGIEPTQEIVQRIRAQVLRTLVDEKLQMQEAKRFDIEISTDEVARSIAVLGQQNNISASEIESSLRQSGIGMGTLMTQIEAELAWNRLVSGLLGNRVNVPDEEVDQMFNQIIESSNKPQYLVSEIFLEVASPDEDVEIQQGAMQLISQMQQGIPFTAVAQQFSQSATAAQGGDIGWIQQGELQPELDSVLLQLQPGQISAPIKTRRGYTILAVRDRRVLGGPDPLKATLDLRQVVLPVGSDTEAAINQGREKITALRNSLSGCDGLNGKAESKGAFVADLGRIKVTDLAGPVRASVAALQAGESSQPIQAPNGFVLLVVCGREDVAENMEMPSRPQIEDRLYNQQLAMQARRYLRDLRRDSTIEMR